MALTRGGRRRDIASSPDHPLGGFFRQPTLDLLHELRLAAGIDDSPEAPYTLHRSKSGEARMTRNPRPGGPGEPARCPVGYLGRRLAAMGRLPLVTDRHGEE